mgnify:CR=1 FL=1
MTTTIKLVDYNDTIQTQQLMTLLNAYAEDPMGGGAPLSEYSKANLISALKQRSYVFSFIAYIDGLPAALCNCVEGFSTFKAKPLMNIHDMAVLPEYRGQGVSQKLMLHVEGFAKERGCCKLTLEVLQGNQIAKNSYIKYGFEGYELDPELGLAEFWEKPL